MEPHRPARRSLSHAALNSAYSTHGRHRRPSDGSLHRPLRRVKENIDFLALPGPLESMLKTTTETGDIGIFSIGPLPPAHTFHQLPRSRTGISETNRPRRPESRGSDRPAFQDDRRRLPSYRDTTSEILSMYGSEGQRSVCSSISRRFDDAGPRSYSMTSYGSRRVLYHGSNGSARTISAAGLQRPRSPFPYPTRLKRPGVRPASPALTDSGGIDYSRMVGIDRVSYRTIHGSYKPFYPSGARRPPPLPLRSDGALSMRSAPNYGTYPARNARDAHAQGRPARPRGPDPRDRVGSGSSVYSGRTSSLTSVIDGYRYSPLGFRAPQGPFPSGSFYYDYTEEFEHVQEQFIAPPSPLAPIPTRVLSDHHRPLVLRQDCDVNDSASGCATRPTPTSAQGKRSQSLSPPGGYLGVRGRDVDPERHSPLAGFARQYDLLSRQGPVKSLVLPGSLGGSTSLARGSERYLSLNTCEDVDEVTESIGNDCMLISAEELSAASKSPERQVEIQSPGKTTIRSVQATILGPDDYQSARTHSLSTVADRDDGPPGRSPMHTLAEGSHEVTSEDRGAHEETSRVDTRPPVGDTEDFYRGSGWVDVGRGDLAISAKALDKTDSSPFRRDKSNLQDVRRIPSPLERPCESRAEPAVELEPRPLSRHSRHVRDGVDDEHYPLLSRHLQSQFSSEDSVHRNTDALAPRRIPCSRSETPMLAPKPISPAKELRVKNSIPQLMKALPPLPGHVGTPESLIQEVSDDDMEAVMGYLPLRRIAASTLGSISRDEPPTMELDDQPDWASRSGALPQKSPKFKVRLKNSVAGSNGTMESRPWNKDKNYPWMLHSPDIKLASVGPLSRPNPGNTRLRLKLSRACLDNGGEDDGTVKRPSRAGRSTTVSDLSLRPPRDLFSSPGAELRMFPRPPTPLSSRLGTESPGAESPRSTLNHAALPSQPTPDAAAGSHRGASLDTHLEKVVIPGVTTPGTPSERGTFNSERGHRGRRRFLRQKLSNLARKAEAPPLTQSIYPDASLRSYGGERVPLAAAVAPTHASADTSGDAASRKPLPGASEPRVVLGGRFRRKLSRWIKGAKTAVKACVHKQRGASSVRPDA